MRRFILLRVLAITGFLSLCSCGPTYDEPSKPMSQSKTTVVDIKIPSFDGALIDADLYLPDQKVFKGKRPALIFVNSWVMDKREYTIQAQKFAKKGYIVLSYSSRGFGRSEGLASCAGPEDIKDVTWIIDWLEENTDVDTDLIGLCGVSLGGGISGVAVAFEPRIKVIAMMSAWSNLYESFYYNNTFKELWAGLLLKAGQILGRLSDDFDDIFSRLKAGDEKSWIKEWARVRSAGSYLSEINQRDTPILIANNFRDYLFTPNGNVNFFRQLKVPKKLIMSPGIHASNELPGLMGISSVIWQDVHNWFDHWLQGIPPTGIMNKPPIQIISKQESEYYHEFPEPKRDNNITFKLMPQNRLKNPGFFRKASNRWGNIEVSSAGKSGAKTGNIPVLASLLDSHTPFKVHKWMPLINKKYGAVYYSQKLSRDIKLRGAAELELWIKSLSEKIQLVAYIYDINRLNVGKLITHTVYSRRDCVIGKPFNLLLRLGAASHKFKRGHKIGIVIDTHDPLYSRVDDKIFKYEIMHQKTKTTRLYFPQIVE